TATYTLSLHDALPIYALDHHAVLLRQHAQYRALLAGVVAADDLHPVTATHVQLLPHDRRLAPSLPDRHQSTSGASDTIFMNRFSRSSRPTGPKMRVARGSPASLMMTAALSSKRM